MKVGIGPRWDNRYALNLTYPAVGGIWISQMWEKFKSCLHPPPKPVDVTGFGFILGTGNQWSFSMLLFGPFFRRSVDVST